MLQSTLADLGFSPGGVGGVVRSSKKIENFFVDYFFRSIKIIFRALQFLKKQAKKEFLQTFWTVSTQKPFFDKRFPLSKKISTYWRHWMRCISDVFGKNCRKVLKEYSADLNYPDETNKT